MSWDKGPGRAVSTSFVTAVLDYCLRRFETGLLCPWGFVLPLARTTVSLLGLHLDVQPASLLGLIERQEYLLRLMDMG